MTASLQQIVPLNPMRTLYFYFSAISNSNLATILTSGVWAMLLSLNIYIFRVLKFYVIIDVNRSPPQVCGTTALRSCEIRTHLSVWWWQWTIGTSNVVPCVVIGRNPLYSVLFFASVFMLFYVSFVPCLEKSLHSVRLVEFRRRFRYVRLWIYSLLYLLRILLSPGT